nr:hypothetical protein CFP56_00762 [Quercus suber]
MSACEEAFVLCGKMLSQTPQLIGKQTQDMRRSATGDPSQNLRLSKRFGITFARHIQSPFYIEEPKGHRRIFQNIPVLLEYGYFVRLEAHIPHTGSLSRVQTELHRINIYQSAGWISVPLEVSFVRSVMFFRVGAAAALQMLGGSRRPAAYFEASLLLRLLLLAVAAAMFSHRLPLAGLLLAMCVLIVQVHAQSSSFSSLSTSVSMTSSSTSSTATSSDMPGYPGPDTGGGSGDAGGLTTGGTGAASFGIDLSMISSGIIGSLVLGVAIAL